MDSIKGAAILIISAWVILFTLLSLYYAVKKYIKGIRRDLQMRKNSPGLIKTNELIRQWDGWKTTDKKAWR